MFLFLLRDTRLRIQRALEGTRTLTGQAFRVPRSAIELQARVIRHPTASVGRKIPAADEAGTRVKQTAHVRRSAVSMRGPLEHVVPQALSPESSARTHGGTGVLRISDPVR